MSFDDFIKNGVYVRGWSPRTAIVYKRAWESFVKGGISTELTKANLESWVIRMREQGQQPAGVNIYIRSMNSYLSWLRENDCPAPPKLKQVKQPVKAIQVFSEAEIKSILALRPASFYELRTLTILKVLLDTGCRVDEILSLRIQDIDMDNMLFTVTGKGSKERKVPFSQELRKVIFLYGNKARPMGLFFACRNGHKIRYRNFLRDYVNLCRKAGITRRVHVHLTRHTFACHFIKNGGSLYSLSRLLGHGSVATTQIYIRGLGVEDFRAEQARLSPLARRT